MYDYGIDEVADLVEVAMKYDIIHKSGAWFTIVDIETGELLCDEAGTEIKLQGQSNLVQFIKDNEVVLDYLRQQVNNAMNI